MKKTELVFGNMNQTCSRFNMYDGKTYDFVGQKEIKIKTTNGAK